jgi:hypothetical protein
MRGDGRQPEVVLKGDLAWVVGQQRSMIMGTSANAASEMVSAMYARIMYHI